MGRPINSEGEEPSVDRLSSLPCHILDVILGKLPLPDAVRTSVLAKDWRYKWLSLSEFVFDDHEFSESMDYINDGWVAVNSLINSFLLNHSGAIKKFELRTFCASHYCDVYQWIYYLSKLAVETFAVEEFCQEPFFIPSHLFSFKKLKTLVLERCVWKIPPSFQKLNFLSELYLRDVSISDEDLRRLIIACPNLESLSLFGIIGLKHLKIHAPKLKCLWIDYGLRDIHIESGADLASVTIVVTFLPDEEQVNPDWRRIMQCLSGLPSLINLALSGKIIKLMAADYGVNKYPLKNDSLVALNIYRLKLNRIEVFWILLSFLSSCPNLEYLRFSVKSANEAKLVLGLFKENEGRLLFPKLKSIQMRYSTCMGSSLALIEFVGSHSPSLKEVIIYKDGIMKLPNNRADYVISRLKKCCPRATVLYLPAGLNFCF